MQVTDPYLSNLMLDVKNMRVKHVRKMFVFLRELGTNLKLSELKNKKDWSNFGELNHKLGLLVVEHGITLGEFATGYVFNIQARQRENVKPEKLITKLKKGSPLSKNELEIAEIPVKVINRKRKTESIQQEKACTEKKRKTINK